MPGEVRAGRQEVAAAQVACRGSTLLKAGGQGTRGASARRTWHPCS